MLKITLTGKVNEVLIILTESTLTIDYVTETRTFNLKPETSLKQILQLIDKELQEYALIPKQQIKQAYRQIKNFNFR